MRVCEREVYKPILMKTRRIIPCKHYLLETLIIRKPILIKGLCAPYAKYCDIIYDDKLNKHSFYHLPLLHTQPQLLISHSFSFSLFYHFIMVLFFRGKMFNFLDPPNSFLVFWLYVKQFLLIND